MELTFAIILSILPLFLAIRCIVLLRKSKISDFMKSLITAILCGILLVSISVSLHHFMNNSTAKISNMSLGVLLIVQGITSGVVFLVSRMVTK